MAHDVRTPALKALKGGLMFLKWKKEIALMFPFLLKKGSKGLIYTCLRVSLGAWPNSWVKHLVK